MWKTLAALNLFQTKGRGTWNCGGVHCAQPKHVGTPINVNFVNKKTTIMFDSRTFQNFLNPAAAFGEKRNLWPGAQPNTHNCYRSKLEPGRGECMYGVCVVCACACVCTQNVKCLCAERLSGSVSHSLFPSCSRSRLKGKVARSAFSC